MKANLSTPLRSGLALTIVILLCLACKFTTGTSETNSNNANSSSTSNSNQNAAPNSNRTETATKATPTSSDTQTALHTPPDGSMERKSIEAALRAYLKRKDNFENAVFDVESLKSHNGWAYIVTDASTADGEEYGMVEAIFLQQGSDWAIKEMFDAPGGGVKEERDARQSFRARYPDAPDDIFPPLP